MVKTIKALILVIIFFGSTSYAIPIGELEPVFSGETVLTKRNGEDNILVKMRVQELEYSEPDCKNPEWLKSICPNKRSPCSVVNYIKIIFNNKPIFVYRRAYSDLTNLNYAGIRIEEEKYFLVLVGEDGVDCYIAKIEFDEINVKSRVYAGCTEPDVPLEKTFFFTSIIE